MHHRSRFVLGEYLVQAGAVGQVALFEPGASLSEIVDALNLLGVGASDLVAILEALKQAGALKAEMVIL